MAPCQLAKCITSPQRIARIIEWNKHTGSLLCLDIGGKQIGVAVAAHSSEDNLIYPKNPIEYIKNENGSKEFNTNQEIFHQIETIIQKHRVCAMVVGWPTQPNGRVGKCCGRVFNFLDSFAQGSKPLLSKERPFVLWEEEIRGSSNFVDKWGRSEVFSRIPSGHNKVYNSSTKISNYKKGDSLVASRMLKDFLNTQCRTEDDAKYYLKDDSNEIDMNRFHGISSSIDDDILDDYESNSTYLQTNVL